MPTPGGPRPARILPRAVSQLEERLARCPGGVTSAGPVPAGEVLVTGVTLDSRAVRPGDLYAALPGARVHGARFVAQAVAAGASAVLTDAAGRALLAAADGGLPAAPVLVVERPRAVLGDLAAWLYGDPGRRLATFAVTGTNGKTTTTFLLDSALRALGLRTGLVGTIEIRSADRRVTSTGTTPEAPDLHALLALMLEDGVRACSMEVSSHALDQHRVDGLVVDVAGFTNLSQDHLDYHHTFEDYFAAKARLFTPEHSRRAVVCVDDAWGRRLVDVARVPVTTLATLPGVAGADWQVLERRSADGGRTAVTVRTPDGATVAMTCPLPGAFNVANALLATAMLVAGGTSVGEAVAAVEGAGAVPGRMEAVPGPGAPGEPLVVVDYAHTPDAVEVVLGAVADRGRPRVVVLGAGGDRDRDKRPRMGAAAARGADVVVVTDDNPRSEPPEAIRAAVLAGAREQAGSTRALVLEVPDRRAAIAEGVARAWDGGVLVVAGKGHEQGQDVGGVVQPFDDRAVVRDVLAAAAVHGRPRPAEVPAGRHDEKERLA